MEQKTTQRRDELQRSVVQSQQDFQRAMGEFTAAIQGQIQRARQKIVQTRHQIDLPTRIKTRPWPWLIGGFGLGIWLGSRRRIAELLRDAGF